MTLKRILSFSLALVCILGMLTGCSNNTPQQKEPELIASALDLNSLEKEYNIKTIQDISSFFGRRFDTWNEVFARQNYKKEIRGL